MKSFFFLLCLALSAAAQDRAEMERRLAALPADAPSVIAASGLDAFKLNGEGASAKTVAVEGRPFQSAIQIRTTTKPAKPYAIP